MWWAEWITISATLTAPDASSSGSKYWRDRGYAVDVKLIEAGFVAAMRSARTDVRSDMVNGFPTKRQDDEIRSSLVGAV